MSFFFVQFVSHMGTILAIRTTIMVKLQVKQIISTSAFDFIFSNSIINCYNILVIYCFNFLLYLSKVRIPTHLINIQSVWILVQFAVYNKIMDQTINKPMVQPEIKIMDHPVNKIMEQPVNKITGQLVKIARNFFVISHFAVITLIP